MIRKNGGMWFFRLGRFGGSIYLARLTECNSREDYILARIATANLTLAAACWSTILMGA